MIIDDAKKLWELLNDPYLSNLTCIHMAKMKFKKGDYVGAIAHLSVDADKIRPTNRELYEFIGRNEK